MITAIRVRAEDTHDATPTPPQTANANVADRVFRKRQFRENRRSHHVGGGDQQHPNRDPNRGRPIQPANDTTPRRITHRFLY